MRKSFHPAIAVLLLIIAALACNAPSRDPTPGIPPTPYHPATSEPPPNPTDPPATAAPASTTTSAPAPTATADQPDTPSGGPIDFETFGTWRRGDQPNGTFEQSDERAYGGQFSGKLQYDFPGSGNDFVVFVHVIPLADTPNRIRAWVHGDGSGHFFNVWIRDGAGEVWQASFGRVEHVGWTQMTAEIDPSQDWPWGHISGPDNSTVDYPIEFYALALDDGDDSFVGNGVIFVDEVTWSEE